MSVGWFRICLMIGLVRGLIDRFLVVVHPRMGSYVVFRGQHTKHILKGLIFRNLIRIKESSEVETYESRGCGSLGTNFGGV